MKQMLLRDSNENLNTEFSKSGPDFTCFNAGEFLADPLTEDVDNPTSVNVNFKSHEMVILGS